MSERERGPVALVTGGSRGIGARLAAMLAEDGYAVAVCGRDAERAEQVAADLTGRALGVAADVTDPAQVEAVVATVTERLGPIDVLVNAAGVRDHRALPWESDPADWWRTLEVNVRGVMLMTSAVLPGMIARGRGHIVDLGSGIAFRAEPRYSAYSVSKAAASSLARQRRHGTRRRFAGACGQRQSGRGPYGHDRGDVG